MKNILFLSLAFLLFAPHAHAQSWTAPTTTPPAGNIASPINVGTIAQVKNGGLSVNAFTAYLNAYFGSKLGVGVAPTYTLDVYQSGATGIISKFKRGTQGSEATLPTAFGSPYLVIGGTEFRSNSIQSIGFGYTDNTYTVPPAEIGFLDTNTSAGTLGSLVFATRNVTTNTAPSERMRIDNAGNVGIGATSPAEKLTVKGDTISVRHITSDNLMASIGQRGSGVDGGYIALNLAGASKVGIDSNGNTFFNGGNVGIGVASPGNKLEVANGSVSNTNASTQGILVSGDATGNAGYMGTRYTLNNTSANYAGFVRAVRTSGTTFIGLEIGSETNHGIRFLTNGTADANERMRIDNTGSVGIGTTAPGYKLEVNGSVGAASFFYTSDRSLKKNIQPLNDSLAKIQKLQGVSFNWKKDDSASVGLIAQDVEKVYPELVNTNKVTGLKSVEYANLVAPLIEAVKEQQKEIDALKEEVRLLKSQ